MKEGDKPGREGGRKPGEHHIPESKEEGIARGLILSRRWWQVTEMRTEK